VRTFCRALLIFAFATGISLVTPGTMRAQLIRASPAAATLFTRNHNARDVRGPLVLAEFDKYVSLGGAIGAAGGLVYGLAYERRKLRPIAIVWDSVIGFTAGMTAGAAVYLVKTAFGRR
jgi:uncharacterized protein YcfJ